VYDPNTARDPEPLPPGAHYSSPYTSALLEASQAKQTQELAEAQALVAGYYHQRPAHSRVMSSPPSYQGSRSLQALDGVEVTGVVEGESLLFLLSYFSV
jgi:hypothetical protein